MLQADYFPSLQMTYLTTPPSAKLPTLLKLLTHTTPQPTKSIAYLSTCAAVDYFSNILPSLLSCLKSSSTTSNSKLNIIPLHGRQSPTTRSTNFTAFLTSTTPTLLLTTDLAARGLDIPQVDVTVQLDPPSDPKTFLHRAGRAGRAGRKGLAVVFLLPGRETEGYPPFLDVRKTPVQDLSECTSSITGLETVLAARDNVQLAHTFAAKIRETVRKDRALHDKAQRGFVSWVRSYSKHAASSIFRVSELRWTDEAEAWGLLRLPRMPELKSGSGSASKGTDAEGEEVVQIDRSLGLSIEWDAYKYKDAQQEKKRKLEMAERDAEREREREGEREAGGKAKDESAARQRKRAKGGRDSRAFSNKHEALAVAQARREKKEKRRAGVRWRGMTEEQRRRETETLELVGRVKKGFVGDG